jgi:hypothetical protein
MNKAKSISAVVIVYDENRPTMRAPDKWESARFTSLFLASGLYSPQAESTLHPLAGNANRWALVQFLDGDKKCQNNNFPIF